MYMHFFIEHNFGHHLNAATPEDPATARYNQSVYSFWFTSTIRQYFSAWRIQFSLLKRKGRGFFSLHNDMLWYGPGGIGSTYRWQGFVDDHRSAFLSAFPDRKGGNHFCRLGDGDYAAVSGWPSMTMTHSGPYLDVPPTGANLTLRVMDFYRCDFTSGRGKIAENWVCLDYGDLFHQMGVDLIAKGNELD